MLNFNYKVLALTPLLCMSFTAGAQQIPASFDTWCPGGANISRKDNSFFVNNKAVKPSAGSDKRLVIVMEAGATFTVTAHSSGLQVEVSGSPSSTGSCSVKGAPAFIEHSERAGQGKFNATGNIPCAEQKSQPTRSCPFGVARDDGGNATVRVQLLNERYRFIFFKNGKPMGAALSQADGDMTFKYTKEGDLYFIKAGKERYEIPEAVIFGG